MVRKTDYLVRKTDSLVRKTDYLVRKTDYLVRKTDYVVRKTDYLVRKTDQELLSIRDHQTVESGELRKFKSSALAGSAQSADSAQSFTNSARCPMFSPSESAQDIKQYSINCTMSRPEMSRAESRSRASTW